MMCCMNISCPQCGQESTLDDMTRRPVTGWLPPGHFQCPLCNYAFQRKAISPDTVSAHGFVIPGQIALVPCQGAL